MIDKIKNPVVAELEAKMLGCTMPSWAKRAKAEIERLEQQLDELLEVFGLVIDELDDRHCLRGNAPGHGHEIPGVWDDDNGELAGKPCAWCAVWNKAKELRANIASVEGGGISFP